MSESKVCVVTGASSGIGRAFAVRLDSLGYKVCLLGRRRDKLQEVAAALSAGETCAVQCSADLCRPVQCSAVQCRAEQTCAVQCSAEQCHAMAAMSSTHTLLNVT